MKYFDAEEFTCKCGCGDQTMDSQFLAQLENAREYAGIPFIITSGKRCAKHNKTCGSSSDNHPSGKASDIKCLYGTDRLKIIMGLIRAGFRRIGIRKDFIHVDTRDEIESLWLY
jgi:zinc D-Ala-D-Ala carboxypeptidase